MDKQRAKDLLDRVKKLKKQLPSKATSMVEDLISEVSSVVSNQVADGPIPEKIKELALQFEDFKNVDVAGLSQALQDAEMRNTASLREYATSIDDGLQEAISRLEAADMTSDETSTEELQRIVTDVEELRGEFSQEKLASENRSAIIQAEVSRVTQVLEAAAKTYATTDSVAALTTSASATQAVIEQGLRQLIAELEIKLSARLAGLQDNHGGNMNRNIAIGGNPSVLSRYTDINLKAGANVTLSYAYNDTTKYTDLTIAATGGSGSGIVRSVNTIAVSTAAGAVTTTDYVYLASGTLTLTLPTSIGNSNLYTVKNIGAGIVTIVPTGAETIDGSSNLILPIQFTSVDLISNNSGNWDIT